MGDIVLSLHLILYLAESNIYRVYLSFYLKYGIYKPRKVKNPVKKRVHKHEFLCMIFHLLRFINPIF